MERDETIDLDLLNKLIRKNHEDVPNPDSESFEGITQILTSQYSDAAHFIYELIQNADDAEADSITFILHSSYLAFIHNGKRKFTISDPALEQFSMIKVKPSKCIWIFGRKF